MRLIKSDKGQHARQYSIEELLLSQHAAALAVAQDVDNEDAQPTPIPMS